MVGLDFLLGAELNHSFDETSVAWGYLADGLDVLGHLDHNCTSSLKEGSVVVDEQVLLDELKCLVAGLDGFVVLTKSAGMGLTLGITISSCSCLLGFSGREFLFSGGYVSVGLIELWANIGDDAVSFVEFPVLSC